MCVGRDLVARFRRICVGKQWPEIHQASGQIQKDEQQQEVQRAEFLLHQALDEDEAGNTSEAIDLYSQSVELCLQAVSSHSPLLRHTVEDAQLKAKIGLLAQRALERAEELKGPTINKTVTTQQATLSCQTPPSLTPLVVTGRDTYTPEEIMVLKNTSLINGREYLPFMSVDLKERFAFPLPFSDHDGLLALSPKQRAVFHCWVRPEDISPSPTLFSTATPNPFNIKQTIVSDCSFIASLAVCAHYELRFKKRVLTNKLFPQNRQGQPLFNPCGKYMVKLHINGIYRKVVIDDRLPMGDHRQLLCSFSSNRDEFWVSLFEKAYMKVMGGYDFPGSSSSKCPPSIFLWVKNIDLHALTGWIPERTGLKDKSTDPQKIFHMLLERHQRGDILATISTGELSDLDAERSGLVPTHAYAILDVRSVMGKQLLLLKNPWSEQRWKGKYSELDSVNWNPQLKKALKYDPKSAQMFDNGIFWIDFESILHFFEVIYFNWNPDIFKFTSCLHQTWSAGQGPAKDLYSIAENSQFRLEVKSPGTVVWLQLTRHITDRNDFAENKEFITLLVYKNEGKKVYYPYDPAPYMDGVRINSPHYLCKLEVPREPGAGKYTLVVSQYCKQKTIHFTLRGYSPGPFSLTPLPSHPYRYKKEVKNGQWTAATAGGCANNPTTYLLNPIYQMDISGTHPSCNLLLELRGPKYILHCGCRQGYVILEAEQVRTSLYNIIPSTFRPNQIGPFFLTVHCSEPFKLTQLR
ncbi:CAPN7 [Cordylochernes scorpioides]|uniref:CAPN7 n=1 Tax=Cordylochernes scorpioides TaxID=51811 RepID=A0ABY6JXF2_9ARAC|nr:CAPN7 [Cordylochernes scorpioides]